MSLLDKQSPNIKRGGKRAGAGRPPGSLNKLTRTLRESIHKAFKELGGTNWLVSVAQDDPRAFIALLGRTIPPATKDPEEEEGLAMALARARQRVAEEQDSERQRLRGMSDEELVQKMEDAVRKYRQGGRMDGLIPDAIRKETTREKTLEEILEESWHLEGPPAPIPAKARPATTPEESTQKQMPPTPPVVTPIHQQEETSHPIPGQPAWRRPEQRWEVSAPTQSTAYDPMREFNDN